MGSGNNHPIKPGECADDSPEAMAQISSRGTALKVAPDVGTLPVEWHLIPVGGGRPLASRAWLNGAHNEMGLALSGESAPFGLL